MSGTVNISRDLWDDTAFRDDEFSQREAWVWMIAEASWKRRTRRIGSQEITLERGQLAGSVRFFAERWKWTPARVFRYLDMLKNRNMIECSAGTAATVITICKYDTYQNPNRSSETQSEHLPEHSRNTAETNEKKVEIKGKEEAKASSQKNRGTRLPKDWVLPKAWGEWALGEGWSETHIRAEADKFRDYWVGKAGRDGTKVDWEATFRNWMRNSKSANSQQKEKSNGWSDTWRGILSDARMADGADRNTVVPLLPPRR